jgi:RNA polymerase sigma-70 factor (ECF subfamily)
MSVNPVSNPTTNPTIFLRLKQSQPAPRELAWNDFHQRYAPIIAGFARRLGAQQQDIDDVVQDVLLGFFAKAPTFVYDPTKGRFRGYLKVCTYRALGRRLGQKSKFEGRPLDQVDPDELAVDQVWNDLWEQELVRRALEEIRQSMGQTKTFLAFEQYVVFDKPAVDVAQQLEMHLNSVYRAKEQITRQIQEKVQVFSEED